MSRGEDTQGPTGATRLRTPSSLLSSACCLHASPRPSTPRLQVTYQNVRRQCGTIWQAMSQWLDAEVLSQTLMCTAVYDLDTGKVGEGGRRDRGRRGL